jgi:hypothetical protein
MENIITNSNEIITEIKNNPTKDWGKLPKVSDLFTIDPFYNIEQYNEAITALLNNGKQYVEWISTLPGYYWYLDVQGEKPLMMNYQEIDKTTWHKTVSKTLPVKAGDLVILKRREAYKQNIGIYINNDWLNIAKKHRSIVFNYNNREQLFRLSLDYGRIYPLGWYYGGSLKLAISFNPKIMNSIPMNNILLDFPKHTKDGALEIAINYKALRQRDKIFKWMETPYFENGKFYPVYPKTNLKI